MGPSSSQLNWGEEGTCSLLPSRTYMVDEQQVVDWTVHLIGRNRPKGIVANVVRSQGPLGRAIAQNAPLCCSDSQRVVVALLACTPMFRCDGCYCNPEAVRVDSGDNSDYYSRAFRATVICAKLGRLAFDSRNNRTNLLARLKYTTRMAALSQALNHRMSNNSLPDPSWSYGDDAEMIPGVCSTI